MHQESGVNSDSSGSSDSSDSRQEQTCLLDFATVCISNRRYLVLGGPWVCGVPALVSPEVHTKTVVIQKDRD